MGLFEPITAYAATGNRKPGGGEILDFFSGNRDGWEYQFFNPDVIRQFQFYNWIKILIVILLILAGTLFVWRILGIHGIFSGKAVRNAVHNKNSLALRDSIVIWTNSKLRGITRFVKKLGFHIKDEEKNYLQYNLERAEILVPGGFRVISADEFYSLCTLGAMIFTVVGAILGLFGGAIVFVTIAGVGFVISKSVPMIIVRGIVTAKDNEVKENFSDLYLMIHYELMSDSGTPLAKTLKSFTRITKSAEMVHFVNTAVGIIDTYGELEAVQRIALRYREVPEITKLMRLIKQQNEGGDIKSELIGFRKQIIEDKRFIIEQKVDKYIKIAQFSFNITIIILVQAILSSMLTYLPDLNVLNF